MSEDDILRVVLDERTRAPPHERVVAAVVTIRGEGR